MKRQLLLLFVCIALFIVVGFQNFKKNNSTRIDGEKVLAESNEQKYWLFLKRKANKEYLYSGIPGNKEKSKMVKEFTVKSGIPYKKPTPLPELTGREYWLITDKWESKENPDTAPYFIKLDVPAPDSMPYGPTPYLECNGQCNWELPGYFGLHGVNGDTSKLYAENPGSSGCIRHKDEDITLLFELLNPKEDEIRYYIEDI